MALAAGTSTNVAVGANGDSGVPAAGPPESAPSEAGPPLTQEMRLRMAAAEAEFEERKTRRSTPQAREQREQSRHAYSGLDSGEALGLVRRKYPEIFGGPAFRPWTLPPGMRVKRFVGEFAALLEGDGDDDRQLVESMGLPLRSDVATGEPAPVDLTLVRYADGFRPRNPVVPTRIGRDARVSFSRADTAVALSSSSPEPPVEAGGRVFYANALHDLDLTITPSPYGAEFSFVARSSAAPEQATLDFDLPSGVELRAAGSEAELVRGTEVVGRVLPPAGWDAGGEPIRVDYVVTGNRLQVDFPHREKDLAYPLYIDPDYEDFGSYLSRAWDEWNNYNSGGVWGWQLGSSPTRVWNIPSQTTGQSYTAGHWGAVAWRNQRGYIRRLEGAWLNHTQLATCTAFGILTSGWTAWKAGWFPTCNQSYSSQFPQIANTNSSYDDWAMLQLSFSLNGYRWASANAEAYGVRAYLGDKESPSVSGVSNSANGAWVGANSTVTVNPTASDAGLGMSSFNLYVAPGVTPNWLHGCNGTRTSRCPTGSTTGSIALDTDDPPEGNRTISGEAFDALTKRTAFSTNVKIDRSDPTLSLSGPLWYRRNGAIRGSSFRLDVTASDSLSGIKTIYVIVDGNYSEGQSYGCSSTGCNPSESWSFTYRPTTTGDHTIHVKATDQVGRETTKTFHVTWYCNY